MKRDEGMAGDTIEANDVAVFCIMLVSSDLVMAQKDFTRCSS